MDDTGGTSVEALVGVDRATMTKGQILDHLGLLRVALARLSAAVERDIAAVSDRNDEKNWDREEIGCVLNWGFRFTQARIVQAHKLVDQLPRTLDALSAGTINPEHARAAAEACYGLDQAVCAKVEAEVLASAGEQSVTQFKRSLTKAIHAVDPAAAEARHTQANRHDKRVCLSPLPDGLAGIWSVHDAVTATAMMARISAAADTGTSGDQRSADERRADALAALVLGTDRRGGLRRRARVTIIVPFDVARGASDAPAELAGYGPVPASAARAAMADPDCQWRRFVVDDLGQLVDCSTSRLPSAELRERIVARDRTCRMPGCCAKADSCEIDHIHPWDGANTVEANLHALCRRHHHVKHEAGWQVERLADGTTAWTSPTGRRFLKPPDPWLTAEPPDDPDPPPE
jgi:hypothetical protein